MVIVEKEKRLIMQTKIIHYNNKDGTICNTIEVPKNWTKKQIKQYIKEKFNIEAYEIEKIN